MRMWSRYPGPLSDRLPQAYSEYVLLLDTAAFSKFHMSAGPVRANIISPRAIADGNDSRAAN